MSRKYLPTIAQLFDRLAIVNLKSIKIPENKKEYEKEAHEIINDLEELTAIDGNLLRAIQINQLINELMWTNESEARKGSSEQNHLLQLTHSLNSIRNQAMNVISGCMNERKDLKLDIIDAKLTKKYGYNFEGLFDDIKE